MKLCSALINASITTNLNDRFRRPQNQRLHALLGRVLFKSQDARVSWQVRHRRADTGRASPTYPSKAKTEGRYFPQVSIMYDQRLIKGSGGRFTDEKHLLVQVSLPKLIYGISIFDIDARFLPLIASKLKDALAEIKIGVSEQAILTAIVQRVDYSKILKISPSYGSTAAIIRALSEHDRKQSSDFNRVSYHHGKDGFYLKFYNSSQGFVIYDKFEEICANGSTLVEREIKQHYAQGKLQTRSLAPRAVVATETDRRGNPAEDSTPTRKRTLRLRRHYARTSPKPLLSADIRANLHSRLRRPRLLERAQGRRAVQRRAGQHQRLRPTRELCTCSRTASVHTWPQEGHRRAHGAI
jgi:hypothetical protein